MSAPVPAPLAAPSARTPSVRFARVAGLDAGRLPLAAEGADELSAQLQVLESRLPGLGDAASDALHRLVPLLDDDRPLRRTVLALRRSTRSTAPAPLAPAVLDQILAALAERASEAPVAAWAAALAQRAELADRLHDAVDRGVARTGAALAALRDDPEIVGAIADASPDFAAAPGRSALKPGRHATRSLLSYATRAAFKTSPFGTLTTVGLAGAPSPSAPAVGITHSYAAAWLDVLARDERAATAFEIEPLRTGGLDSVSEPVAIPELIESRDFVWRRTLRVALRGSGAVLEALQRVGRAPLKRVLEEIGGDDPFAAYLRMLDAGLLRVVAPWGYAERHALRALAARLASAVPDHPAAALLAEVVVEARAVTGLTGRERGRRRAALRDRADQALAAWGVAPGHRRFEVYVDAAPAIAIPGPSPELEAEIQRFTASVRRSTIRSPAYEALVAALVDRCGPGGTIDDPWRWLLAAGADEQLQESLFARPSAARAPASRPLGRSMPPVTAAVAFQVVHGDEPLIVINQLHSGQGGLVSRFGALHDGLRPLLAKRARRLARGALAVEFVPSWEVNGMQAAAAGTLPRLSLPVDAPVTEDRVAAIDFTQLRLRHDPATESIELLTEDAMPVVPFYLGLVPAHLLSGPERILAVLADPWQLPRVGAPTVAALADLDRVVRRPRRVSGRIVLRRAVWTVPTALLPALDGDDAELLHKIGCWRRAQGIPAQVFVRLVRVRPVLDPVGHKPVPIDLRSPYSLSLLLATLADARGRDELRGVEITEALPAPHEFARASDGSLRAVEHVVLSEDEDEVGIAAAVRGERGRR
ncbi:hypothetical protein C5C14_06500 [Rathayibacter rathayi]|uniref:hypothetical protein n=1 Tax=Rathayibacter rathayi TaxID=33887 RepID=UPI000CE88CA6|nr:hypothetical protein [Rathayibacter rathayi]PPF80354.1 hypothetical protein C5C14_06500 [Rathayibacter rathayi]PPG12460.1 hypothetical protein C5C11_09605 [Rathayibacter rathayi]